jgi:hypothetical protein
MGKPKLEKAGTAGTIRLFGRQIPLKEWKADVPGMLKDGYAAFPMEVCIDGMELPEDDFKALPNEVGTLIHMHLVNSEGEMILYIASICTEILNDDKKVLYQLRFIFDP